MSILQSPRQPKRLSKALGSYSQAAVLDDVLERDIEAPAPWCWKKLGQTLRPDEAIEHLFLFPGVALDNPEITKYISNV